MLLPSVLRSVRMWFMCAALLITVPAQGRGAVILDKVPDRGPLWFLLSSTGSFIYADSFLFNGASGTELGEVGAYLRNRGDGPGSTFRFEVFGDNANAPDPNDVLGVTNYLQVSDTNLRLVTSPLLSPVNLVNGARYWIAASTVGGSGTGSYQFGGHTQNSIYLDNGTFWISNDPAGQTFRVGNLTPEMAIYAATSSAAVPEPTSMAVFGIGAVGMGVSLIRRRMNGTR